MTGDSHADSGGCEELEGAGDTTEQPLSSHQCCAPKHHLPVTSEGQISLGCSAAGFAPGPGQRAQRLCVVGVGALLSTARVNPGPAAPTILQGQETSPELHF